MQRVIVFLMIAICSAGSLSAQEKIKWMSFGEALKAQKKEPRKIFMDVYTDWCGPCKLLDKNTFQNPDVAKYVNQNYYAVKFNAEGTESIDYQDFVYTNPNYDPKRKGRNSQHLFAHAMKINAYPSIVFFDEKGNLIQPLPGYKTPQQLELFLKMIESDDYLEITTAEAWEEYQSNFESTFKS
ncbi:MAG TPA: thioredoxin family protein [Leeuwenhoekiella sp.]|uniref:thioredoxin family protein n=1 Tax=Leeuwenhoekiella sp. ZYFB001 TaxID=2719912 RepID=UPI000C423921|nr:thioredoxin fold domain-containing protein [Leeuwenhoekiella sp. ZYFB001]MAS20403.1 thioredoxin family protein [Leeuwenhoekiella sp.]MBH13307.1 thioredoxin family protein [Leeuwenhoekiella sp.]HAX14985.1 thioredoxin family protein [Leeuwenhoekiella sp.]HCQ77528.1 thioredoxin family protein [Leeuwenhoekiella sp.]|tara:strand:- start:460 stop:1008 length:549 start_codon:yes stop_codon:yes gene_type:complete